MEEETVCLLLLELWGFWSKVRQYHNSTNVWHSSDWQTFLSQWNSIYTMNWNLGKHEKGLNGEILKWQIALITTVTKSSETFTCALFCINWQLVLLRISHTTVRKIRFKMYCVLKYFNLLTVWVQCDIPHREVEKKSSSVVQNKKWHPYCPCSCYFTAALNMKLRTSELDSSHPGIQAFWWNQAQCVWSVTVSGMPTYAVKN